MTDESEREAIDRALPGLLDRFREWDPNGLDVRFVVPTQPCPRCFDAPSTGEYCPECDGMGRVECDGMVRVEVLRTP